MILTVLQRLSHEVGWGYKDVVDRLEEKRKIKAQAFHERKVSSAMPAISSLAKDDYPARCSQTAPKGCR